jgi:hypothetical protein
MVEIEQSSGYEAILTSCLELRFVWMSDHWKHEFVSTGQYSANPRVWSLEGGHALDDPTRVSGPMYQQLDVNRDPSGIVRALLIGQAGPHHFSASFTVEEEPDGVAILVDVADRCSSKVEALAATYLIDSSEAELQNSDGPTTLTWRNPNSRLVFEAESPARVAATESIHGSIRIQALAAIDPSEKTHRFRYSWRWHNSPGRQIWDHTA